MKHLGIALNNLVQLLALLVIVGPWIAGVVLAHGVWSTLFAIPVPFWAWYLFVERCLVLWGFLP